MKRKPNLIEMFERINATKIPSTALINEMMENNVRMKTPWSSVVDFFNHYKIDVNGMDQNLVRQVFVNWDNAPFDGISDLEESPDGKVSVEFDGTYGKHWMTFDNAEEWHTYYQDRVLPQAQEAFNTMVKHYQEKINDRQQKKDQEIASRNTIGNMISPEVLNKLKGSTVAENQGDVFAPTPIGQEPYADNQDQLTRNDPDYNSKYAPTIPEGNRPGIVDKEVRFLKVGDVLSGSRAKIIQAPFSGVRTPTGKAEVGVEYPNGKRYLKIWGKYTVVGVIDSAPSSPLPPDADKLPDQISNNEQPSINI